MRIAGKGIESSERLGRRRWVIERTMSWLGLAAALCCYKRLVRLIA
ncbi:IS1647-like transposase [Streptomyces hygroscopicus subsp. jinggangensis 5008]|nr:IS1647-like transposase [Streptomyces hygroscopicus subsp. jinggangensis 5008]AGF67356.1 IS1647-like transposase [Streptomyces hygroscopicus subsp. jinggangensis TL01]